MIARFCLLLSIGLLARTASGQLLHRYDFATDGSANDTVGTANGTIYGGATVSGGALNTPAGVTGTLSSGLPQNCVGLPSSAVAGITNAFALEIWYQAAFNGGYCTLFAFSDGSTANYLQGTPARGASPYQSDVEARQNNGTGQFANGIYCDNNALHHMVVTYDGTNVTYYLDGTLPNFSGLANSFTNTGLVLANFTYIGIAGGSPWGDQTIFGQTYDFRIYGQSLTPAQVATLYALGSDAANSAITAALVPPTSFTWNGGGVNNNWGTGLNWVGGSAPAPSGTSLLFAGGTRTSPNLEASYSITGLAFSNNAGSFAIGSDSGSTLTLAGDLLDNSTNAQTLSVPVTLSALSTFNLATNLTLSGALSSVSPGGLIKAGNGILQLSAANPISGGATISAGAIQLSNADALQSSTVTLNASNGLWFKPGIGTFNVGGLSGAAGTALLDTSAGPVTLSVGANNAGTTFSGALTGTGGSLVKVGTGTLVLNGASTYTGGTTVSGGILAAQNAVAPGLVTPFGTGPVTVNNGAVLEVGYAPNNAFGSYSIPNSVTLDNGSLYAWDASHRVTGNLTIGAGGGQVGSTFDAPWEAFAETNFPKALFIDGLLTGTGNLTVQDPGWALGNAWNTSCAVFTSQGTAAQNSYSGTVTINSILAPNGGSYLYLAGPNVLANATITLYGNNDAAAGRMGVSTLLFGGGNLPGPGYATIGGLTGGGDLVLADTVLFAGGTGYSNGAPVALTVGYNNSSTTYYGILSGAGSLIKAGTGTLTLAGACSYTGNTDVNGGGLVLSGGWLASSNVTVAAGTTLDVSGLGLVTLAGNQSLLSGGSVIGSLTASSGSKVYAGTAGGLGTNTITGDLTLASGALAYCDVGTSASGANDRVAVAGALTANGNIIHLRAPSTSVNLDTNADYILFTSGSTIVGAFAPAPVWDVAPANAGHFAIVTGPTTVTLHYYPDYNGPSGMGVATPALAVRNQKVLITVAATNGNPGTVSSVKLDASAVGGSATLALSAAGGNVWTNSVTVSPGIATGSKSLTVTITDSASFAAIINLPLDVVLGNAVWNGAGADANLSSNLNWTNQTAPGYIGDSLQFAGTTRLAPSVDNSYILSGILFDGTAGPFNLSSGNGSTLTVTANGIVNNSPSPETLNVPITMSGAQTFDAANGNLTLGQGLTKAGSLVTVKGAGNLALSGSISGAGSLFKQGSGLLTLSDSATWDGAQASSGGFSGPLIAQAGAVAFNNGSLHTVTGELVIGGVVTNGGPGNNSRMIVDNATLNVSSWFSVGRGNGVGGVSSDLVVTNGGVVTAQNVSAGYNGGNAANLPKGSLTLSDTSALTVSGGNFHVGESSGSDMTLNVNGTAVVTANSATMNVALNSGKAAVNINGGAVSVGSLRIGNGANNTSTANGTVTVNSGTLSSEGDIMLGFAGSGAAGQLGKMVINGGTVSIASTVKRWFIMSQWDTATARVDVNSGNLRLNANTDLRFAISGNTGTNVFNLNGGAVTFYSDNATTIGGSGVVDLHQGTGGSVRNTFNLNGGRLSVFGVLSANNAGNRTFNFNGGTLTAVANNTSFLSLGSGSAAAYVLGGGAIIDTAGFNVTIPQALLSNGVDPDGGLIKNGAGILTLSGGNTYGGNTTVSAGTLEVVQPTLGINSTVIVSNTAVLQLDFATTNQVKALVLNGVSQAPGVYNSTTSAAFISGSGSLLVQPIASNPTNLTMIVSGNSLSVSWPADHLGWILQQQTNAANVGLSTNWVDVAGSGSLLSTIIPINPATPSAFYRLRHP